MNRISKPKVIWDFRAFFNIFSVSRGKDNKDTENIKTITNNIELIKPQL